MGRAIYLKSKTNKKALNQNRFGAFELKLLFPRIGEFNSRLSLELGTRPPNLDSGQNSPTVNVNNLGLAKQLFSDLDWPKEIDADIATRCVTIRMHGHRRRHGCEIGQNAGNTTLNDADIDDHFVVGLHDQLTAPLLKCVDCDSLLLGQGLVVEPISQLGYSLFVQNKPPF